LAAAPDAILVIADAGDVVRHLPLVLACRDLGLPVVLALNLADEAAARGVHVDTGRLAQLLAVPVRRTVARSGTGVAAAVSLAVARARRRQGVRRDRSPRSTVPASLYAPAVERALAEAAAALRPAAAGRSGAGPQRPRALVASSAISPRGAATLLLPDLVEPERRRLAAAGPRRWRWSGRAAPPGRPVGDVSVRPGPASSSSPSSSPPPSPSVAWAGAGWPASCHAWRYASPAIAGAVLRSCRAAGRIGPAVGLDSGILGLLAIGVPYVLTFYLVVAASRFGYLAAWRS